MNTHATKRTPGFRRSEAVVQRVGWPIEGLDEEMPAAAAARIA